MTPAACRCDECGSQLPDDGLHWCEPPVNLVLCRQRIAELEAEIQELHLQAEAYAEEEYER